MESGVCCLEEDLCSNLIALATRHFLYNECKIASKNSRRHHTERYSTSSLPL